MAKKTICIPYPIFTIFNEAHGLVEKVKSRARATGCDVMVPTIPAGFRRVTWRETPVQEGEEETPISRMEIEYWSDGQYLEVTALGRDNCGWGTVWQIVSLAICQKFGAMEALKINFRMDAEEIRRVSYGGGFEALDEIVRRWENSVRAAYKAAGREEELLPLEEREAKHQAELEALLDTPEGRDLLGMGASCEAPTAGYTPAKEYGEISEEE